MLIQEDCIPQPKILFSMRAYTIAAVATGLVITLTSCGIALNEGNGNPNTNLKLSDGGTDCIEHSLPKIERYFKSEGTSQETQESWACLSLALEVFKENVTGQNPNYYTPEELRTFLQTYFLGDIKLTDKFLEEAFRLKQIILGGDRRQLTKAEIVRAQDAIQLLRGETVRLLPHLKIVLRKVEAGSPEASNEKIQAAKIALNEMTTVLGQIFDYTDNVYTMDHAKALLQEMQALFAQSGSSWTGPAVAIEHLDTFFVFKSFLLEGTDAVIFQKEWGKILRLVSQLYGSYLQYEYLVKPASDMLHGLGLKYFHTLLDEGFGVLQTAIDNKSTKVIPFETLDKVVEQLYFLKVISPDFMQDNTLKGLFRTVIGKVYQPAVNGVRPITSGLNLPALDLMRKDFYGFAEMQSVYDVIESDVTAKGEALTYQKLKDNWPAKGTRADHLNQIRTLLNQAKPQMWDDQFRVVYDDSAFELPMTPVKFTEMNWRRMLIFILARGYAETGEAVESTGLRPVEDFQSLYWDFRLLAHELEFLDKNDSDIWKSTAEESMIFFLASDGKVPVSIAEGYDFLGLALGSGKISSPIFKEMREECKHTGELDAFGEPLVEVECYRGLLYDNFTKYFEALPGWALAVSKLTGDKLEKFKSNLEYVTLDNVKDLKLGVKSGDIGTTASVFQYGESIFWKFDKNKDGKLNYPETGDEAFKLFHEFLAIAAKEDGLTSEGDLRALFTYLLRYKRTPQTLPQKAEFLWWKLNKGSWKYEVSRTDVIDIIAAMKQNGEKNSSAPAPETP